MRFVPSKKLATVTLALAGLAAAPSSPAATATGVLAVSAIVLSTCVVVATPLVFNNYTLAILNSTATITVTCTPDVLTYTVGLDAGLGGGTTSTRKVTFLTNTLNYGLYRDAGHTQNWGNSAGVDTQPSSAGTGTLVKLFTVHGQLAANQPGAIGTYLDTVQINVEY
ncbi:Spore coat protein U (SCPU) domain-containing protein [Polaromonas sp. YR568]|uniref:Csu type fimbrial protein n=1 Tax=Polaromonas sp. YR568 TaxID=1855301 RepID=UPI0008E9D864|nr:spore coat U domain-containing protein [Polaromonas sp. YR568]SFU38613.1 Spore coat protein U (SCPU) domain-containing protein [Polaromonas sp. YR568]